MATLPEDVSDQNRSTQRTPLRSRRRPKSAARPASSRAGDDTKPLVAEARARMAELAARELALQQREQELEQQYRLLAQEARETAQREWADSRDHLREHSAELDAQSVELAARRARLEELERWLAEQKTALQEAQKETAAAADRLRHRIATVRQREKDLERRIGLAHQDIVHQREELDSKQAAAQKRVANLRSQEQQLQTRKAGLQRELNELQSRASDLDQQHAELNAARLELEDQRRELDQTAQELESRQHALAEQQQALDARWRATGQQRQELARQAEALDARRRTLDKQQAASDQQSRRLQDYEQQLRGRNTGLENEARRLAAFEAELAERNDAVRESLKRSEQAAREAERHKEEALALREQAEARDAESRQTQLSLELDQEDLARQRAALSQSQEALDNQRARREAEFDHARAAIAQQAERLRQAQQSLLAGPRRWWLRSSALAITAALLAALAWLAAERPLYLATSEIRLVGNSAGRHEIIRTHEQRLRTPAVIEQILDGTALRQAWQAAHSDHRVQVISDTELGTISLRAEGPDAESLQRLVRALADGYAELSRGWPEEPQPAPNLARLRAERDQLTNKLNEQRRQQQRQQAALESLAHESQRDALRAAVQRTQVDYDRLDRALAEKRAQLAAAESGPVPRGTTLPAEYEDALAADPMYQEDLSEFRTSAVHYRTELAAAMLLVADPIQALQSTLAEFHQTVAEQHELKPPTAVAALLEQCSRDVSTFGEQLPSFTKEWNASLSTLQEWEPDREVIELVTRQNASAGTVRQLCHDATTLVETIRTRLDDSAESSGGRTREVVVTSLLRSRSGELAEGVNALVQAADSLDLGKNFRLDALDRQLRGLRARLDRRQTAIRQMLQSEADEHARRAHAQHTSQLRDSVRDLEQRQESLITGLTSQLDELRRLDQEVADRIERQTVLRRNQADLAALEQEISTLDQRIAGLEPGGPPASLEVGDLQVELIAGHHRQRNAALVAAAALALAYAICLLTVIRNPLRQPAPWEEPVGKFTSASATQPPEEARSGP